MSKNPQTGSNRDLTSNDPDLDKQSNKHGIARGGANVGDQALYSATQHTRRIATEQTAIAARL